MSFESRSAPEYPALPILQEESYQERARQTSQLRNVVENALRSQNATRFTYEDERVPHTPSGSVASSINSHRRALDTSYGSGSVLREGVARVRPRDDGRGNHTIPIIVSDDVVSGTKRDGWMSPVRRFFCLLITFDFLLVGLLWVITVIVPGKDVKAALEQQVLEYTIYSSMFDCVMAAFSRFLIGILFYAVLDINHWCPVALTTLGTTVFAVAKVFEYGWKRFGTNTFDVMLVVISFILSWGELWFLDFRVLPLEMKAREIIEHFNGDNERTPLLVNTDRGMLQRYVDGSLWDGSVANFYSPLESPEDSGDEVEEDTLITVPKKFKRKTPLDAEEAEYRLEAEEALQTAWKILNSSGWRLEKSKSSTGDTVHTKIVRGKKLFKLTGIVDLPPKLLLEELFYRIEGAPTWNPTLTECKILQPIDSHTDISYQVCASEATVSSRDFVNLRHWQSMGSETYFAAGISIQYPNMPTQGKRIRGENGPGGFSLSPAPEDNSKCLFQWLLDTDLKGWIPQYIIDTALSGVQFKYIEHMRCHARKLHDSGRVADYLQQQETFQRKKPS